MKGVTKQVSSRIYWHFKASTKGKSSILASQNNILHEVEDEIIIDHKTLYCSIT